MNRPVWAVEMIDTTELMERALAQGMRAGFSEDVIAQVFVAQHYSNLAYCRTSGAWYEWNGVLWRRDELRRAFEYVRRICRTYGEAAKFHSARFAEGVEKFAGSDPLMARRFDDWDPDPMMLGTPGGAVDLRTGRLLPGDPSHMITMSTSVAPATDKPERWLAFLHDVTRGDVEFLGFLQRAMGYALTGNTTEHALFFVHGPGGNGKSVFLNTLTNILSDYARTAPMDVFLASRFERHSTDLASLRGARVVTASETQRGRRWDEQRVKQLTGGDPITARFMRRDNFTYKPQFKPWIIGNHEPALSAPDDAMRRRFNIIPFNHKPAKVDRLLEQRLADEYPAILQWMIDGCLAWQRDGLMPAAIVREQTNGYFEDQDLIGRWIAERCDQAPSHFESFEALYESFQHFARHWGEYVMSSKALGQELKRRFKEHRGSKRGYLGLRLRSQSSDERHQIVPEREDDEALVRP